MFTFYTQEAVELCLTASLPKPVDVCEKCGGGFWKKIKKGSDIEKYLIFCRCPDSDDDDDDEEKSQNDAEEIIEKSQNDAEEIIEKSQNDAGINKEEEKPAEIPKHLRSRYKPNHHKARKWTTSMQNDD
jgi:hypothetical protein